LLSAVRKVLSFEMTIAEWIGTAVLAGVPYLLVGVLWSVTHTDHLSQTHGVDRVVSFLGSIASWPALLISNVCMT
jgi:hypothetical protein